jgi:predicted metal-binding membrane protein
MASPLSLPRSPGQPERLAALALRRDRRADALLVAALAALAAVAWAVTANRMRGMDMGPNTDPGARL